MTIAQLARLAAVLGMLLSGLAGAGVAAARDDAPAAPPIPGASGEPAGTLRTIPCPFPLGPGEVEGTTAFCVAFTVPQDWGDPASRTIELTALVKKATGPNPLPDPIVLLVGGPGESGVVTGAIGSEPRLRETRDLVFPAMRGTLFSQRLDTEECGALLATSLGSADAALATMTALLPQGTPAPIAADDLGQGLAQVEQATGGFMATCFAAFAQAGLDPAQFSTRNAARDVVELMAALGYQEYNLRGVSYGARLALRILNDYPRAGVRSVVLDSAPVPSAKEIVDFIQAPYLAVRRVFADCEASAACAAAYPGIWDRTIALIRALDAAPLADDAGAVTGAHVVAVLADLSNSRPIFFPAMIAELERGETGLFRSLQSGQIGLFPLDTPGATLNVQRFVSSIVTFATSPTDPLGSFAVLVRIGAALNERAPGAAVRAVISETFDGEAERELLAQLDAFGPYDWAGLRLLLAVPDASGEATPAASAGKRDALPLLRRNSAFFLMSAITCNEYARDTTLADADAAYASLDEPRLALPRERAVSEFVCANVPSGPLDPGAYGTTASDVPVLVLHGELDAKIPPATAALLADQLANATVVVVPAAAHNVWSRETGCVADIATAFIDQPNAAPDTACLDSLALEFVLPVADAATPAASPAGA